MKVCSRCHQEKPLSDFHKRSDRITGVVSHCKECQKQRKKTYLVTQEGKRKAHENSYNYYHKNKEKALLENKLWREKNKEHRKEYSRNYERTHRTRDAERTKLYTRKSCNKRYRTNPRFRLSAIMGTGIRKSISGGKQGLHWESLVGYTYCELIERLKKTIPSGYSWKDYQAGNTDLEIDHIIPISAFNISDHHDLDFKRCWSLNNLRLLPKSENRSKNDSLDKPFQPCLNISI